MEVAMLLTGEELRHSRFFLHRVRSVIGGGFVSSSVMTVSQTLLYYKTGQLSILGTYVRQ